MPKAMSKLISVTILPAALFGAYLDIENFQSEYDKSAINIAYAVLIDLARRGAATVWKGLHEYQLLGKRNASRFCNGRLTDRKMVGLVPHYNTIPNIPLVT